MSGKLKMSFQIVYDVTYVENIVRVLVEVLDGAIRKEYQFRYCPIVQFHHRRIARNDKELLENHWGIVSE
jgi:hypothetical protein